MTALSKKKKQEIREAILKYPASTNTELAEKCRVSKPTITNVKKEFALTVDTEFLKMVAGRFIFEFETAKQHWMHQITELETMKNGTKTVFVKDPEKKGRKLPKEFGLSPMEKLAIDKHITKLRENILFLASQGEVVEVIKIMRSGINTQHLEQKVFPA
jgi:DNA mismatch repair ATPase MutL